MAPLSRRGDTAYVVGMASAAHFVSHVYLLAYPPLFTLLATEFDVTTGQLGLLVTAIYVPTLLFQLPVGGLVDRVGARRILVSGTAITSVGIASSAFATSFPLLLACAALSGLGQTVFHPANYALMNTVTAADNEGMAFSAHTFGGFAGFAVAPIAIGFTGIAAGWQTALLIVGSLGIGFAAFVHLTTAPVHTRRIQRENAAGETSTTEVLGELLTYLKRPELVLVFSFYFFSMTAFVGLQSFTAVLGVDAFGFDDSTANTLLTVHLACTALGVLLGGPLADRVSPRAIMVATLLPSTAVIWIAVLGLVDAGLVVSFGLFGLIGLFVGVALPSRDKFANAFADPESTGKSFGFFFTGLSLGAVVGPAILGWLIDAYSVVAAFTAVGGILLAAVGVVIVAELASRAALWA